MAVVGQTYMHGGSSQCWHPTGTKTRFDAGELTEFHVQHAAPLHIRWRRIRMYVYAAVQVWHRCNGVGQPSWPQRCRAYISKSWRVSSCSYTPRSTRSACAAQQARHNHANSKSIAGFSFYVFLHSGCNNQLPDLPCPNPPPSASTARHLLREHVATRRPTCTIRAVRPQGPGRRR